MADRGLTGSRPDLAIFADTGWEPQAVYENVEWLSSELSYPVVNVTNGRSLRDDVFAGVNTTGKPGVEIPAFVASSNGHGAGMNPRQCTQDYKIAPIRREIRRHLGFAPRTRIALATSVELWLGITIDEAERMKSSWERWIVNRYPLVEANISRNDCLEWFANEYPDRTLPRSACIGCPYHSDAEWHAMRENAPDSFADAVAADAALRDATHNAVRMFRNSLFLHRRRVPLAEAVSAGDRDDGGHWGNECAGICGV